MDPKDMYIICLILPILTTAAVVARMRLRYGQKLDLKLDDWTVFGGLVS